MDAFILDTKYVQKKVIDAYVSFIWTERFNTYGDFELYVPVSSDILTGVLLDDYVEIRDSDRSMIVESIQIDTTSDGPRMTISGRSLESILLRRIVWKQTILKGNLQDELERLFNENIISPTEPGRKIDMVFKKSEDPKITALEVDLQLFGETIYDVVADTCANNDIGFKVTRNFDNQFVFELYSGTDRSYEQTDRPYVVFSPDYDNLLESNYLNSKQDSKTIALVSGEGEGSEIKTKSVTVESGAGEGLSRREMYVDAGSISTVSEDGTVAEDDYNAQLAEKGEEELSKVNIAPSFEGEIENQVQFRYGIDFQIGDIVQIANEYDFKGRSRITEYIRSYDAEGANAYPTFVMLKEDDA